jgi:transposase InsO family protein
MAAAQFLRDLIKALPYKIHTILTDNGVQFTNRKCDFHAGEHIFDRVCGDNGIEHRLTKVNHPWTNGQVERMNRTIKEQLRTAPEDAAGPHAIRVHLQNMDKCKIWTSEPKRFTVDTIHHMPGLNN